MSDLKQLTLLQNAARAWNNEDEPGLNAAMEEIEIFLLERRTQPEATAPAQDLSAAIPDGWQLVPIEPTREMWDAESKVDNDAYAGGNHHGASSEQIWHAMLGAAPAPPADALSAGDSEKALDALLTRIGDAFEAYERYGAICEFEGNPMIYADTLTEIVTLRGEYHAILQSQKGGNNG